MKIQDLIQKSIIPRTLFPAFDALRKEAFEKAQVVFTDRVQGYNVDHECYEEQVFGVLSLSSEIYKRARRLVGVVTPFRVDEIRDTDINRILDICVDTMNYLSWMYALTKMASGFEGHANSDDAPNYLKAPPLPKPFPTGSPLKGEDHAQG